MFEIKEKRKLQPIEKTLTKDSNRKRIHPVKVKEYFLKNNGFVSILIFSEIRKK
jgi:hypothetical protein